MREWNQLDECIKSSPTVSVFKRELMRLTLPDLEGEGRGVEPTPKAFSSITFDRDNILKRNFS